MERFAYESHQRAIWAIDEGRFGRSLVAVYHEDGTLALDEFGVLWPDEVERTVELLLTELRAQLRKAKAGYRVLAAESPRAALGCAAEHARIDLAVAPITGRRDRPVGMQALDPCLRRSNRLLGQADERPMEKPHQTTVDIEVDKPDTAL